MTRSLLLAMFLVLSGPALAKKKKKNAQADAAPPEKPLVQEAVAQPQAAPGALWSEVHARQLMGIDGNARQIGDLVTVRITEHAFTSLDANTATARDSTSEAAIAALLGAEQTLADAHPNLSNGIGIGVSSSAAYNGSGATTRGASFEATLTCEVIEVLANGNLRVWGAKELRVNRETQYLVVQGVVRPRDIQMDNTVMSELLADAKVEITGAGTVSDRASGPSWGARIIDFLWPF